MNIYRHPAATHLGDARRPIGLCWLLVILTLGMLFSSLSPSAAHAYDQPASSSTTVQGSDKPDIRGQTVEHSVARMVYDAPASRANLTRGDRTYEQTAGASGSTPEVVEIAKLFSFSTEFAAAKSGSGRLSGTAAKFCSFSGATLVLMADGTKKAIDEIRVGDKVLATDPQTGEQVAKAVEQIWAHDDKITDLVIDGEVITTTEDHPFWNATDQQFQRADQLDVGDRVEAADGRLLFVSGLRLGTTRKATAYNLSVQGIHTYHVGENAILVHNVCSDEAFDIAMHAFDDHGAAMGFRSVDQMGSHIDDVMNSSRGVLRDDGTRFWVDHANSAIIFRGPNRGVPGSFYRPDNFAKAVDDNMARSVMER